MDCEKTDVSYWLKTIISTCRKMGPTCSRFQKPFQFWAVDFGAAVTVRFPPLDLRYPGGNPLLPRLRQSLFYFTRHLKQLMFVSFFPIDLCEIKLVNLLITQYSFIHFKYNVLNFTNICYVWIFKLNDPKVKSLLIASNYFLCILLY